ncbi:hypothetical protein T492DRAFT_985686 [Pavlovales sp. CCMP2436]|nr:hypothetical protein T492DRAFT_985686 [Pavlovales sp. CCMP2436]
MPFRRRVRRASSTSRLLPSTSRLLSLIIAAAWGRRALAGQVDGIAGPVPKGYTELCVLRADIPSEAVGADGKSPSPYAVLTYGGFQHKTPTQDETLAPVWQASGCQTYPTTVKHDGSALKLQIELWNDRTRAYDPFSVMFKDELIANGTTVSDTNYQDWKVLDTGPFAGARVLVAVTICPPSDQGQIDPDPSRFKTLTSTPAFFLYVGCATFIIIVCVCCIWGKGAPPRPIPARLQDANSKSFVITERPAAREPSPPEAKQQTSTHPDLTVEVSTPTATRGTAVVAVDPPAPPGRKVEEGRAKEPPLPPPSSWSSFWAAQPRGQ